MGVFFCVSAGLHGDDDQILRIDAAGLAAAKLVKNALKVYQVAPHRITDTHMERLDADRLAFLST